ncbi:E3 ubiquitin-protein ligase TRIM56-like [Haliotis rufescens]|uniref:E3 ubiquitin-protein ligase TRIM56-like n=1 Tax=Haliotis rufescens TaxID=6454 RepID=UPI001EB07C43|nr:E3 ubiquitin-protein ligase TRIM56-like [Haliotis rufescens]XP_046371172.1 E3 ubiquitin-protein ligase TRIM56-like [Haliotis rufescens]XP_048242373.1 E3 ubiquitin-protein ligase TRIM56-like [Haliotis rufescens]
MDLDKVERLRDRLLMCPICMDEYKDPRLLPCHHTVCLDCIHNILQASSITGRMFRCPQCRRDVCVPRGGIHEFPLNFYIISLQDELGTKTYHDTCDMCKRDWLISQFRCVDCDMVICKFCIHEHRLFQHDASRQYNIMRIEITPADVHLSSTRSCPKHLEEILQLYCCTCDKPVCITCICEDHKRHETVPMATKLSASRLALQEELDRLASEKRHIQQTLGQVQATSDSVSKWADGARKEVQDRGKDLHGRIDKMVMEHISVVGEGERRTLHELGTYSKDLRKYSEEADKGLRFLQDLQEGDMCLELLDCYDKYRNSLEEQKIKSSNKAVELKKFTLSEGWDLQFQQYYAGSVGKLACYSSRQKFLTKKGLLDNYSVKEFLFRLLTPGKIALLLVVISMLFTIGQLIHAYISDPNNAQEVGVGLFFCVYLFLASYFAYRKS